MVGNLESKGRIGLLAGDGAAAEVIGGVIDNVLAYLRQNPDVAALIDAQVERLARRTAAQIRRYELRHVAGNTAATAGTG